jgi:glycosyltransferase involved in cell wall biosynthesis
MKSNGKIRVLQLGSPTGLYGAERWILALVNNIDRAMINPEVAVILDDPTLDADLCQQAERIGIPATIFEAHGKFNWSAVKQLRTHIVRNGVDILHTHGYKTDIIGILAVRGTHCKIITTPHGWSTDAGYKLKIYESLDRGAFCFFDGVAPLSEDMYNGLKSIPFLRHKLRLIPNGVDLSDIDQAREIADEILEWKSSGYFVIGYIGQLIPRKGLDVLLRALAKVESKKWRLAILGDGDSRYELSQLARESGIEDKVRFFGFRSDRLSFLKGFDTFALPSRLEGVPRCLMEAMACHIPVVASDIPGCRDLVRHGQTGILFKPGSIDALHEAVTAVMRDGALRDRLASKARTAIEEEWSASSLARRYSQLYSEIVDD